MDWLIFSIASTVCFAGAGLLNKFLLTDYAVDSKTYVVCQVLAQQIFIVPIFLAGWAKFSYPSSIYAIILGSFYLIPSLYYFKAMQVEEVSRVTALEYLYIIFVFLGGAVLLGESLTWRHYLGGSIMVISVLLMSYRYSSGGDLPKASPAIRQFCIYWVSMAVYFLALKCLLSSMDEWNLYAWSSVGNLVAIFPFLTNRMLWKGLSSSFCGGAFAISCLLFEESFHFLGTLFSISAYALGSVSLVTSIGALEPFITLMSVLALSRVVPNALNEEASASTLVQKLLGMTGLCAGVYFIY